MIVVPVVVVPVVVVPVVVVPVVVVPVVVVPVPDVVAAVVLSVPLDDTSTPPHPVNSRANPQTAHAIPQNKSGGRNFGKRPCALVFAGFDPIFILATDVDDYVCFDADCDDIGNPEMRRAS